MPTIDLATGGVFVRDLNPSGARPVVMIHGLLTNQTVFYGCGAFELAKHRRVVLYDLRGHGLTSLDPCDFRLETLSGDLFALVDALSIEHADLVGYSFGAAVAINAVLTHPGRVGRLALIEPFGLDHDQLPGPDPDVEAGILDYSRSTSVFVSQRRVNQLEEQVRLLFTDHHLYQSLAADADFFAVAPVDQISDPVWILGGRSSVYAPDARLLAQRIPNSVLRLTRGDHNLPVTRPRWVRRHLIAWDKRGADA